MEESLRTKCQNTPLTSYKNIQFHIMHCSRNRSNLHELLRVLQMDQDESIANSQMPLELLVTVVTLYIIMILFGACGNGLIIYVVAANKSMRVARNVYIVNLAISDFTLCLFTQPMNLLRLLPAHQPWVLGDILCKLTSLLQGTNIFVSTMSIAAIALDRFQVIVYPTHLAIQTKGAIMATVVIWLLSLLLASPLCAVSKVTNHVVEQCSENSDEAWVVQAKFVYSIGIMLFQYLVPLYLVTFAYIGIFLRLRARMATRNAIFHNSLGHSQANPDSGNNVTRSEVMPLVKVTSPSYNEQLDQASPANATARPVVILNDAHQQRLLHECRRQQRTNTLLASIALIFAVSWLPLHIFNVVMDMRLKSIDITENQKSNSTQQVSMNQTAEPDSSPGGQTLRASTVLFVQAMCLLLVLGSACMNPILYGWLNENFRREIRKIFFSNIRSRFSVSRNAETCAVGGGHQREIPQTGSATQPTISIQHFHFNAVPPSPKVHMTHLSPQHL